MPQLVPFFFKKLRFGLCFIIKNIRNKSLYILEYSLSEKTRKRISELFPFLLVLFFYLFLIWFILIFNCKVAHAATPVYDLLDGTIDRTPLLQEGQSLGDLAHGWHPVTGGHIAVGTTTKGYVPRILGISISGFVDLPNWDYNPQNEAINKRFAWILFEMKEAGQKTITKTCLDHITVDAAEKGKYSHYLNSYLDVVEPNRNRSSTFISDKLIDGLGTSRTTPWK